jgi:hypothetical protein
MKNIALAFLLGASCAMDTHSMNINTIAQRGQSGDIEGGERARLLKKKEMEDNDKCFGWCVIGTCFFGIGGLVTLAAFATIYAGDYGIDSSYSSNS